MAPYIAARASYEHRKDPEFEYNTLTLVDMELPQWLTVAGGVLLSVALLIGTKKDIAGGVLVILAGVVVGISYFSYLAVFFAIGGYYKTMPIMSGDEALALLDKARATQGTYAFHVNVKDYRENYKVVREECRTNSIPFEVASSDTRINSALTRDSLKRVSGMRVTLHGVVELDPVGEEIYKNITEAATHCRMFWQTYDVDIHTMYETSIPGLPSEEFLVTEDGKWPTMLSPGYAIAAGIFLQGASYAYRFEAMPSVYISVIKENVSLAPFAREDTLCADLGECK